MLTLAKMAITGGLSCGKSTVCRILKELGAYVVSADDIVHQLLSSHTDVAKKVVELLGTNILVDNQINRTQVARIVFSDPQLLKLLEEIIHPPTYEEIERIYKEQQGLKNQPPLFVAEIPLLFETHAEPHFDFTVTVAARSEICMKRFMEKTGMNEEEFDKKSSFQLPLKEKAERADYVILNNSSLEILEEIVKELLKEVVSRPITSSQ